MNTKTQLLHHLYSLGGFGQTSLRKLAISFQTAQEILVATREDLAHIGIGAKTAHILLANKEILATRSLDPILTENSIAVYSLDEPEYPKLLKEIPDAPTLLYVRGNIGAIHDAPCVAIVGTRKPTDYGRHVARTLARDLTHAGVCIVSGLALGLDAEAHTGTLEARGKTVAVLGNGLLDRRIAPRNHLSLAKQIIASGGALVSELAPDMPANAGTFPMRNRIIAGLSTATVVVEAGEKSGTLITTRLALDYNRDVFAVPGSILSPLSQGANRLLKDGARVVTCAEDILETLALASSVHTPIKNADALPTEDKTVMNALADGPTTIQQLAQKTRLSPATLGTRLTMLELNGYIRDIGNGKYIKM